MLTFQPGFDTVSTPFVTEKNFLFSLFLFSCIPSPPKTHKRECNQMLLTVMNRVIKVCNILSDFVAFNVLDTWNENSLNNFKLDKVTRKLNLYFGEFIMNEKCEYE